MEYAENAKNTAKYEHIIFGQINLRSTMLSLLNPNADIIILVNFQLFLAAVPPTVKYKTPPSSDSLSSCRSEKNGRTPLLPHPSSLFFR
jgi:hypothetical protein